MLGATLAELRAEGLLHRAGQRRPRRGEGGGAALQPLPRGRHRARPRDALDRRGHGHRRHASGWPSPRARPRPATRCRRAARCSSRWPTATSPPACAAARRFADLGFAIVATAGTAADLRDARRRRSPPSWPSWASGGRGRRRSSSPSGKVDLVVNTPAGSRPACRRLPHPPGRRTSTRSAASPPSPAALAAANGMAERAAHPLAVRSLQEYHAGRTTTAHACCEPHDAARSAPSARGHGSVPDGVGERGRWST